MEDGLSKTTSFSSQWRIFKGWAETGGSCLCTLWHTKSLLLITVAMVATVPFTGKGAGKGCGRGQQLNTEPKH